LIKATRRAEQRKGTMNEKKKKKKKIEKKENTKAVFSAQPRQL
jgi:hypothetical protein